MAVPIQPRFAQFLRRAFNLKERFDPSLLEDFFPDISSMIGPVMPDYQRLRGETLWGFAFSISAVGAQFSRAWIGVSAGSISVITALIVAPTPAAQVQWGFTTTTFVANTQAIVTDARHKQGPAATLVRTDNNAANPLAGALQGNIPFTAALNPALVIPINIVVSVDRNLVFLTDVVNVTLQGMVMGYERQLEPSEAF